MVDSYMTKESRNIGEGYSCFLIFAVIFSLIGITFHLLSSLVFWNTLAKKW